MTSKITWIHLSDLHFQTSAYPKWNEKIVLRSLLDDIQTQISLNAIQPDFICVSGDIAYSGQTDEYKLAKDFFDNLLVITGLSKDRIFIVPGNHDVDRNSVSTGASAITEHINQSKTKEEFRQIISNLISNSGDRNLIFKRLQNFRRFFNNYFTGLLHYGNVDLYYAKNLELLGINIFILGVNSAWLSYGDGVDQNHIIVSEHQIRKILENIQRADICIAIMHHPFEWLHVLDRADVKPLITNYCDFILHGHLHETDITLTATPDSDSIIIGAGTIYDERNDALAYNLVQLNLKESKGKIILRRYSDKASGFWTADVMTYHNIDNGEYSFPFPKRLHNLSVGGYKKMPNTFNSDFQSWPVFGVALSTEELILERTKYLEFQLHQMIEHLHSIDSHPTVGNLLKAANYIINTDIHDTIQFFQNKRPSYINPWAFIIDLEKKVNALIEEFLDYKAGSLLSGEDESVKEKCSWAEALLKEIGNLTGKVWDGACVLANKSTAGPNSHLIRLPFPGEYIWDLPLVVHQYVTLFNFNDRLNDLMVFTGSKEINHVLASLLGADMLATHFCGPAYAFAAMVLWLDSSKLPNIKEKDPYNHQSSLRYNSILLALDKLGDIYTPEIKYLKKTFSVGNLSEEDKDFLTKLYKQVVSNLYGETIDHKRLKSNAKKIFQCYEKGLHINFEVTWNELLNASWYSRMLFDQSKVSAITEYFLQMFRTNARN